MFLLDIRYDYENNEIIKWIKDKNICRSIKEKYYPKLYVDGDLTDKDLDILSSLPGVKDAFLEEISKSLLSGEKENVICLITEGSQTYNLASIIDKIEKYRIYNVDINAVRKYLLEKNIFPMKNFDIDDGQFSIDYNLPDTKNINLSINTETKKGIKTFNDKIGSIVINDEIIIEGKENDIIEDFNFTINEIDPDIIFTENGDSFEIAYLYHRSLLNNIKLQLGREGIDGSKINGKKVKDKEYGKDGRSYFSYGRILYKPRMHLLSGRLHIDKSYFLYREGGLSGLIDISRITGVPIQECLRLSPGSAITAMQVNYALRNNILIPWRRHNTEYWKTAEELLIADRGALIIEPKVGIHENVYELDFASLFPNIMVNHNISPETVLCECCLDSKKRVPFIGYNICEKHTGLVPKVLKPLIERRIEYKRRKNLFKDYDKQYKEYDNKQNILKWLLVTSFGYMGFNKAIFGKIECHESITAYARDILLKTMRIAEDMDFDIIHGIVDCLWVKGDNPEKLCKIASEEIGINLELRGKFNWIVFLPNKTNNAGSLNRYYGVMDNGELKIRGIELRRSDSPVIIKNLQESMITKLAEAKNTEEFFSKIKQSLDILKEYVNRLYLNDIGYEDLILQTSVSKEYDKYVQFNNQVAAMMQLKQEDIDIKPGQSVRYIIADSKTKDYRKRIILPEFADNNIRFDTDKYKRMLLKAAESILLQFGYTEKKLDDFIRGESQLIFK